MRILSIVVAAALSALTAPSFAAGFRFIDVPADAERPAITGGLWYPCAEPPGTLQLDPFVLPVTKDCPLSGKHPLVVVSHGRGGGFLGHHGTAEAFADAGFIVAAINHPGDTFSDKSRINELSVYVSRPADIKRLVDYMLGSSPAAPFIDPARIGFFGFSRGGYTGLAVIGANADWANATAWCGDSQRGFCPQVRNREFPAGPIPHDPRIKAAVVADPLAIFFTAEALASIGTPVQLWASELGGDGVSLRDVAPLDMNLPARHEFHVVRNAGHFAFVLCPPDLAQANPEVCTDRSGFDRVAFHEEFNAAAVKFLQDNLNGRK